MLYGVWMHCVLSVSWWAFELFALSSYFRIMLQQMFTCCSHCERCQCHGREAGAWDWQWSFSCCVFTPLLLTHSFWGLCSGVGASLASVACWQAQEDKNEKGGFSIFLPDHPLGECLVPCMVTIATLIVFVHRYMIAQLCPPIRKAAVSRCFCTRPFGSPFHRSFNTQS